MEFIPPRLPDSGEGAESVQPNDETPTAKDIHTYGELESTGSSGGGDALSATGPPLSIKPESEQPGPIGGPGIEQLEVEVVEEPETRKLEDTESKPKSEPKEPEARKLEELEPEVSAPTETSEGQPAAEGDLEIVQPTSILGIRDGQYFDTAFDIYISARFDKIECLNLLLKFGASIEGRGSSRELTPLHIAAASNQKEAVELLLGSGTAIEAKETSLGYNALVRDHRDFAQERCNA